MIESNPDMESDGESVVLPRRISYGFLDLEDFARLNTAEPRRDTAARFLEAIRQKNVVRPVRAQIANIFDGEAAFLKGENWREYREALARNPDDPDLVFEISKKLANLGAPEALSVVKNLIFLPGSDGEIKLRWPEHEELSVLAAFMLRQDGNMRAVVRILTDANSQPRFPGNPQARRLLVRGNNVLHHYEASKNIARNTDPQELFKDPMLLASYVETLLRNNEQGEIMRTFSALNAFFRANATVALIRQTLVLLHKARAHDLMLYICQQMLIVRPHSRTQEKFCDFASRAFNSACEYKASVELLVQSSTNGAQSLTPRFPRNFHCMKNLAYALIGLGQRRAAEAVVDEAVRNGLPRTEFRHLDERLRGGIRPPTPPMHPNGGHRRRRGVEL